MKLISILLSFVFFVTVSKAQTAEDSIKAVVNKLFVAMKSSDGEGIKTCFTENAVLQTISKNKEQQVVVESDTVSSFAAMVKTMPKDAADERVTFESIHIDGPMAAVWAPYEFYYQGKFSHCGVDHFVLVRIKNEWKIQYLIDTRRKQDANNRLTSTADYKGCPPLMYIIEKLN